MSEKIGGGCFCGNIRYEITGDPLVQLFCFCKDCRAISGTDGFAAYIISEADFRLVQGAPTKHDKISKEHRTVIRHFCGTCGSNLWGQTEFGLISVAAGSLDDPSLFNPTKKVFVEDAPDWARIPEFLDEM